MSAADDDDAKKLAEISRELPPIDIDDASAQRIAHAARQSVGRGPSPKRFIEPVLVGVLALSMLVWTILKLIEVLR